MARAATQLWSEIDGETWLDNPRRKRSRKGRKRGRRRSFKRNAVLPLANPKRRRGKRRRGFMLNKRHGRRRGFRRNPVFSSRGLLSRIMDGAKGGAAVLLGEATAAAVPKLIPVPAIQTGFLNAAAEAATAILTAPLVAKVLGPKWAQVFLYGGFAHPLKGLVIAANIPIIAPALAAYPGSMLQALPQPSLSAYGTSADDETLAIS